MEKNRVFILWTLAILLGCQPTTDEYKNSILEWQNERLENLIREDGWATLAGLFPLKEGNQNFGSSADSDILFPDFAPGNIGTFSVSGDTVWMKVDDEVPVLINEKAEKKVLLSPADDLRICKLNRLVWHAIKRGDKHYIRLRDKEHPARTSLKEIPYYPIDAGWKFEAVFHESPVNVSIPNVLDMIIDNKSPGYLTFEYKGVEHKLLGLDGGPEELFLIFYDLTSGEDTYGGGRYMYVQRPADGEKTILDFNKAYSPPCAFTSFATCLLPPKENRLPFEIIAGEKDPHFLH